MAIALLSGCAGGSPAAPAQPSQTDPQPARPAQDPSGTDDPGTEPSQPAEPEQDDPYEKYVSFVDGEISAVMYTEPNGLIKGRSYDLKEMSDAMKAQLNDELLSCEIGDIQYGYIDCGADGEPELVVRFGYYEPHGDFSIPYDQYVVFKDFGEELRAVDAFYTFYRTESYINEYGYVSCGGSSSAAEYGGECRFINADGEPVFLYSYTYIAGQPEAVIPYYYLPKEGLPGDYYAGIQYGTGDIELDIFNFEPYDGDEWLYEADDAYKQGFYFVFSGADGETVWPSEENMELYNSLKLKIIENIPMMHVLREHENDMGVTDVIRSGGEVGWMLIDNDWLPKG